MRWALAISSKKQKAAQHFEARVNVNDDRFLAPDLDD